MQLQPATRPTRCAREITSQYLDADDLMGPDETAKRWTHWGISKQTDAPVRQRAHMLERVVYLTRRII